MERDPSQGAVLRDTLWNDAVMHTSTGNCGGLSACEADLGIKVAHAGAAWRRGADAWHEALLLQAGLLALLHELLLNALLLHGRCALVARHQLLPLVELLLRSNFIPCDTCPTPGKPGASGFC